MACGNKQKNDESAALPATDLWDKISAADILETKNKTHECTRTSGAYSMVGRNLVVNVQLQAHTHIYMYTGVCVCASHLDDVQNGKKIFLIANIFISNGTLDVCMHFSTCMYTLAYENAFVCFNQIFL